MMPGGHYIPAIMIISGIVIVIILRPISLSIELFVFRDLLFSRLEVLCRNFSLLIFLILFFFIYSTTITYD